jgi:hypothetical protein
MFIEVLRCVAKLLLLKLLMPSSPKMMRPDVV